MMSANLTKQPIARTLPSPAVTASEAPYLVSPHPLPLIHITSPEGHVQEIFPPARRTAVRYNPDAIGRLQAARFADTPPAGAALPAAQEQEAPVAELPSSSLISVIRAAIARRTAAATATTGAALIGAAEAEPGVEATTTSSRDWSIEAMDEFAQTRAPDDLFDDDFTPLSGSVTEPALHTGHRARGDYQQRGRGERGGRGRERGRGRAEVAVEPARDRQEPSEPTEAVKEGGKEHAVRGDRSGTGGVKKPKLSEDELTARMEAVKLNNAKREAAHARAEADEASFQQREQVAQSKRLEERQNRRVMDGERERNRLRKLNAVGGREWDAEKKEEDFVKRGGNPSQFRRGAYGGVAYDGIGHNARREDNKRDSFGTAEFDRPGDGFAPSGPRGRGGRGRGRGRARGGYDSQTSRDENVTPQAPIVEKDFPALPGANKAEQKSVSSSSWASPQPTTSLQSPVGEKSSWADQVESTVPAPPSGW